MKILLLASLVALVVVFGQGRPTERGQFRDMIKNGADMLKTGVQALKSFSKEDIQELMSSCKKPEEKKALKAVIQAVVQKKPENDIINKLMDCESGPLLAEKFMKLFDKISALKGKYTPALQKYVNENKKS